MANKSAAYADTQSFDNLMEIFEADSINECLLIILNLNAVIKGIKFGINSKYD